MQINSTNTGLLSDELENFFDVYAQILDRLNDILNGVSEDTKAQIALKIVETYATTEERVY